MWGKDRDLFGADVSLYGIKIALVVGIDDPKACERIKVRVLGVNDMKNEDDTNYIWAAHCAPSKSGSGDLPSKGDYVYVTFLNPEDPMTCIWLGFVKAMK